MKKPSVALINYEMGNLRSVSKALEKVGFRVHWVHKPSQLKNDDAMVLPGVGAFPMAVRNLKKYGLWKAVKNWIQSGKPFLGICLGYQLLFESSNEFGRKIKGLSIFEGEVKKLNCKNLKIPHMGWNQIEIIKNAECKMQKNSKLFKGIPDKSFFYFVHSYIPFPKDKKLIATATEYGTPFASSIQKEKLFACQFHPEKSGENGLKLLRRFRELC